MKQNTNLDYESLFQNAPCGYFIATIHGTILCANKTFTKMSGYNHDSLVNKKNLQDLFPFNEYLETSAQIMPTLYSKRKSKEIYLELIKVNGKRVPVMLHFSLEENTDHEPDSIQAVVLEMEKPIVNSEKLLEAHQLLTEKTNELSKKNEALKQYAIALSHDLKEPLYSVSGLLNLFQKQYGKNLDEKGTKCIGYAYSTVKRMGEMVNDLLEASNWEEKTTPKHDVGLNDVLSAVMQHLNGQIEETSTKIIIEKNLPVLKCYPVELMRLFQNLISNGMKYVKKGITPEITISARKMENIVEVIIKDNGIGIPQEMRDKIFDPYFRIEDNESIYTGKGIGLSVCKKIVELHKGSIRVESALGIGSEFIITFPLG